MIPFTSQQHPSTTMRAKWFMERKLRIPAVMLTGLRFKPEQFRIKCGLWNSNQDKLLVVSFLLASPELGIFRSWRNLIVSKIILHRWAWGGEDGRTASSFIRVPSEAGWADNPIKSPVWLRAVWANAGPFSSVFASMRKYQWVFVRLPWFLTKSPVEWRTIITNKNLHVSGDLSAAEIVYSMY